MAPTPTEAAGAGEPTDASGADAALTRDEAAAVRERLVLSERLRGRTFQQITEDHGIRNPDVILRRALATSQPEVTYERAELVRLEEARVDALQDGIWDRARGGEPRAVEVALKVLERRARLKGLDHADAMNSRLVEIEQAKVTLMASALVDSLRAAGLSPEQQESVTSTFLQRLRAAEGPLQVENGAA